MTSDSLKMLKKTSSMDMLLDFATWTVKETCQYLEKEGLGQWADKFKEHQITGDKLQGLTDANLMKMGIEQPKDCKKILHHIRKLWQIPGKVFNDPIHGHVELHPLLIKIIDTHQFQRLRYMKQLGGAYFVYPGASHNRFEHSIGVAHLAGELVKSLRVQQPKPDITDEDMLCVQIAGLCHDLGHGPFSHMFDSTFIPKVRPNTTWKHEDASCTMFDYLVKNNGLRKEMKKYGLELPKDQVFIKEMIVGPLDSKAQKRLQTVFRELKAKVKDRGVELKEDPTFIKEIIVRLLDSSPTQGQLETAFQVLKEKVKTKHKVELKDDPVFIKEIIAGLLDSITGQEQLEAVFRVLKEKVMKDCGVALEDDSTFIKEIIVGLLDNITTQEQLQAAFQELKEKVKTDHGVELPDDLDFIKEIITPFWLVKEKMVKAYGVELPDDLDFIKEVIGGLLDSGTAQDQWKYKGREKNKSFLYEIVANKTTGIDVDKFDYFARDCYHLGLKNNFDYRRFLKFARVCEVNGKKQICIRDKEVYNLYNMFHTRYCIHRGACQHKVSSIIQTMMADAFVKADKHIQIEGSDGTYTLSGAINDMEAYTKLTDCVFEQILNFPSKDLTGDQKKDMGEAKQILRRIITRDLYRCLGEIGIKPSIHEEGICGDLKKTGPPKGLEPRDVEAASSTHGEEIYEKLKKKVTDLEPEDFAVVPISMDYGMKYEDPIENVRFYSKNEPNKGFKIEREQVSNVLPTYFSDELVRVYYKGTDEAKLKTAKEKFEKWWDDYEKAVRFEKCSKKCRSRNGDCVWKMYRLNRPQSQRTPESNTEENIQSNEVSEDGAQN